MTSAQEYLAEKAVILFGSVLSAIVLAPVAHAADDNNLIRELTQPTNFIELGALYVDRSSAKFGEYNGLDKSGGYFIGNFQLYGAARPDSAFRWRV